MRNLDRHAAGQGHVAFAREQRLTRVVRRHERRGARGLDVHAGSAQVQAIRDTRREEVFVVTGMAQQKRADLIDQFAIGENVVREVRAHPAASPDTDRPVERLRWMPRVFQRLPRAFEQVSMLRIHDPALLGRQSEELRIEVLHVVQDAGRLDVTRVLQSLRRLAIRQQFFVTQLSNRLHSVYEVVPELVNVARARHSQADADNRNTALSGI